MAAFELWYTLNSFYRYFSFGSNHLKSWSNPEKLVTKKFIFKFTTTTYQSRIPSEDFQNLFVNFIQLGMACLNFQSTYFREYILVAFFIRFRSTSFSEHHQLDTGCSLSLFFSRNIFI